jgi:hypothetical protein
VTLVLAGVGALILIGLLALVPAAHCRVVALVVTTGLVFVFASNTAPTSLWTAVALGGPVLLAVAWYRRGLVAVPAGATMGAAAVFLAVITLSSCLTGGGFPAFVPLSAALGWTVTQLDDRERVLLVRALVAMGTAEAVYAAAQAFLGVEPLWGIVASQGTDNPFAAGLDRAQATFGQAIVYGFFSALLAFLAWSDTARLRRPLRFAAFGVLVGGLFLSGSRSAALALAAAIAVHALVRPGLLPWVRNLALASTVVVLLALLDFGIRAVAVEALDSGSWLQRLGSLTSVPRLLERSGAEFWFGPGFGSEQELYRTHLLRSPYHFTVVDDFYVYVLGTTGLVGVVALLVLLTLALVTSGRSGRGTAMVVVVMCAAFDLLVWRSSAAVFVTFLVLEPSARGMRRTVTSDEAAGEAEVAGASPPDMPSAPRSRRSVTSPAAPRASTASPAPSTATVRSHQVAAPAPSHHVAQRPRGRRAARAPVHENLEEPSREAPRRPRH